MTAKNPFTEYEKAFYKDGYHLMASCWDEADPTESIHKALTEAYKLIDGFIEELLAHSKQSKKEVECKKGCAWCCHQAVYAGDHELTYIKRYIRDSLPETAQEEIIARAKKKYNITQNLTAVELQKSSHPCPLLVDKACSVYEARPMACRIYLSFNEQSCLLKYKNKQSPNDYPQLMEFPLKAGRMLNEGIISFLKINKIQVQELRLEEGFISDFKL